MVMKSVDHKGQEELLGNIETVIAGSQYYDAAVESGEVAHLERDPDNSHDANAIRVLNRHFDQIGYLPRRVASWLAPLIDTGRVLIDGLIGQGEEADGGAISRIPLTLSVFLAAKGKELLERREAEGKLDALHEVVRRTYLDAKGYTDPNVIEELAAGLKPLTRQELLPETHMLLALMPHIASQVRLDSAGKVADRLRQMLGEVVVGEPLRQHNLSIFPLSWPTSQESPFTLLDTAIEFGEAIVKEISDDGDVPEVNLVNESDRPILITEGEILVGAKQNRIVNTTVLVAPHTTVLIPVNCVERGRWEYESRVFRSRFHGPPSIRAKRMQAVQQSRSSRGTDEGDQLEVWDDVDAVLCSMDVDSPTDSLTDGYKAAEPELQKYREAFELPEQTAGVIVATGNRVAGMDLFGSPGEFASLWPRLADAYYLDALRGRPDPSEADPDAAGQFIDEIANGLRPRVSSLGLGDELEITGNAIVGSALLHAEQLCHLSAFSVVN